MSWVPKHRRLTFRSVVLMCAACAVTGVLLAGCGSSYTRADFIQRADGICTGTTRAIRLLKPTQFAASSALQRRSSVAYFRHTATLVALEARRLSALPRPPESTAQRRLRLRWVADVHESAVELQALAQATATANTAAMTAANSKLAANPVVKLAAQYGARACAGPGATYR